VPEFVGCGALEGPHQASAAIVENWMPVPGAEGRHRHLAEPWSAEPNL